MVLVHAVTVVGGETVCSQSTRYTLGVCGTPSVVVVRGAYFESNRQGGSQKAAAYVVTCAGAGAKFEMNGLDDSG